MVWPAARHCQGILDVWPIEWKWADAGMGLTRKLAERNQLRWDPPQGGTIAEIVDDLKKQKGERPVQVRHKYVLRVRLKIISNL